MKSAHTRVGKDGFSPVSWWSPRRCLQRGLVCLVLLTAAAPLGAATNSAWFARAWQTEDGLPEHTIVGLEQTPDGFLWVATHRSLSRFDGVRFREFAPAAPASPTTDQIRAMLADRQGRLWLARDGGRVVCIERDGISQVVTLGDASAVQARAMTATGDGSLWLSDSAGAVFRIQDGSVRAFGPAEGLPGQGFCWIVTDANGQLWYAQAGEVGFFRSGRFERLVNVGQSAVRLCPARAGGVWLSAGLKLYRLREGEPLSSEAELKLEPGHPEATVTALFEDREGGVWLGTSSSGLFRYDGQRLQPVATSHPNIINVFQDTEGNIWVGTRGGGLNRLSPRALQLASLADGLPFAAVQSACEDKSGNLWAVGQNGALACRSNSAWRLVSNNSESGAGGAVCVTAGAAGSVLVGTRDRGLFRYQDGVLAALPLNRQLTNQSVHALHCDERGNLWIALNSFVARFRPGDGTVRHFALPTGASDVRTIVQDASGDVWMGTTSDGLLLRLHGDMLSNETTNLMQQARHIRCLQATPDGSLWFGFAGQGLGRLKHGRFFCYRATDGLWDEFISHVLPDDQGGLWLAGNRGVYQLAQDELEAVAEGRAARMKPRVFGRGEGVPNLQATFGVSPAAARTADGRLLVPTLTGLLTIEPRLLRKNSIPPPVVIERLTVNGRTLAAYDLGRANDAASEAAPASLRASPARLRLGPGVNRMEIEFTALSLTSPDNVAFRYQLEGLEQDWVEAGTARVARYPRIPPGNYRFRVTACNPDGVWNGQGPAVELVVQPHLWEAAWFRWTCALAAIGLVTGSVLVATRRRYHRKLERLEQQRALERERARIAQDLHDDLGAGLVEINFGSELAQDAGLNSEEVREHAREIGARAREMVTALDEIVWAVNPKHDHVSSLASYFCQFAQHFLKPTAVRCHLAIEKNLPEQPLNAEQRHSLFMAFKEALCNVVQHAGATDVWLAISVGDGKLQISVRDNGRGLDLAAPRNPTSADGLGNMRERLRQLGGSCEFSSRPGEGMTIRLIVPLARKAGLSAR